MAYFRIDFGDFSLTFRVAHRVRLISSVKSSGHRVYTKKTSIAKTTVPYSGTQMMTPPARQGLLDDMEDFVRQQFGDRVTRPIVVTLTTATLT